MQQTGNSSSKSNCGFRAALSAPGAPLAWGLLAAVLVINAFILGQIAFKGYYMFDFSAFLDSAWRVYRGQRPYADFYFHTGPVHLYYSALFFHIFGFGMTAILAHMVFTSSVIAAATFLLTYRRIPLVFAVFAAMLSAAGFYWFWPHPWYDSTANLWGLLAVAVLAWKIPLRSPREAFWTAFFCAAMSVLSLLAKSNYAIFGPGLYLVFLFCPHRLRSTAGFAAGASAALLLAFIFFIPSLKGFLENTVEFYGFKRTNQIVRFLFLPVWLKNLYWLPLLTVYLANKFFPRRNWPLASLFYVLGGVSLFALNTGSHRDWAFFPPMGIFLALGYLIIYQLRPQAVSRLQKAVFYAAVGLLTVTSLMQLHRSGIRAWMHYDRTFPFYPHGTYELKAEPLRGWNFLTAEGEILDDMVDTLKRHAPPEESLLILGDVSILNALTGRDGYRGVPFVFDMSAPYPSPGEMTRRVRNTITANPPDWIVMPGNYQELLQHLGLEEFIKHYTIFKTWKKYALMRRTG